MLTTIRPKSTTDMQVTSIRLDRELKERLKALAGQQGYQSLIRDILWNYVHQCQADITPQLCETDICASIAATAQQAQRCVLTGQSISPQDPMLLGVTTQGTIVPLCPDSLSPQSHLT